MKAFRLVVTLMLVVVIAACGKENVANTGNAPAQNKSEESSSQEQTASTSTERTIEHAMGSVTLKQQPERVVLLFNGAVDNSVALGVTPVGAVESWEEKPWYLFLRDKMEGVKNLGEETQPNLEAIIALQPDLIIGAKSRHEKIYSQLSDIAPTVMVDNVFDWKGNLKIQAKALYKEKEAEDIFQKWDERVAEFKQKVGDNLSTTEVSIIRFESDGSARFYVTGFAGTIFEELGLARPEAQQVEGQTVVNLTSKEQMQQLDGDYIFDITRYTEDDASREQSHEAWTTHPLWKNLKGVKAGKYYPVDVITWNLSAGALSAQSLLDELYKYFEIE